MSEIASVYTKVERFRIEAQCASPLHVGSFNGDRESVLVHPDRMVPFIQASSLCGVMRAYYEEMHTQSEADALFGSKNAELGSRIKFTDGFFQPETLRMEIRPRVAINDDTGTVDDSSVQGTSLRSGNKFELECIGAGSVFSFEITILSDTTYKEEILACLGAMDQDDIQFGGQKSNGFGFVHVVGPVKYIAYDMKNSEDLEAWLTDAAAASVDWRNAEGYITNKEINSAFDEGRGDNLKPQKPENGWMAYEIVIKGETDGELLIKDIAPEGVGEAMADAVNIRDAKGNYIIPGSSFKGVLRNRMEQIASYMDLDESVIRDAFGAASETGTGGCIGNLRVMDTVIQKKNDVDLLRTRIHIDKFTGGVMNQMLFRERNAAGKLEMHLKITEDRLRDHMPGKGETAGRVSQDGHNADCTMGLLIFALRDLACEAYQIGSGYSIGKGYIKVESIEVTAKDGRKLIITGPKALDHKKENRLSYNEENETSEKGIFDVCMNSLEKRKKKTA